MIEQLVEVFRIENACKKHAYENIEDVFNINFSLYKGETIGLIMRNTGLEYTLLDILSGKVKMDSGSIYIDDELRDFDDPYSAMRAGVFIISRTRSHLVPGLSIAENIYVIKESGSLATFIDTVKIMDKTDQLLKKYEIDDMSAAMLPKNLTSSKRHIIEILKAVQLGAKAIFVGNVFIQYSQKETDLLIKLLKKIVKEGISVAIFANKLASYLDVADRLVIIRNGTTIANMDSKPFVEETITTILAGKYLPIKDSQSLLSVKKNQQVAMEVRNLTDHNFLENLSFKLYKGEVLGIIDVNGICGNSLADVLVSKKICTGEVITGNETRYLNRALVPDMHVGRISESDNLMFRNMSLYDNITLRIPKQLGGGLLKPVRTRISTYLYRDTLKRLHCENLIEKYGEYKKLPVMKREDQMRIQIAKWVFSGAEIIVMINPGIRFDAANHHILRQMVTDVSNLGLSIIIITTNVSSVQGICSRIINIDNIADVT